MAGCPWRGVGVATPLILPNRFDEAEWRRKLQEADRRSLKLGSPAQFSYLHGAEDTLVGAGAIGLRTHVTAIETTGADALTLADGAGGQEKVVIMTVNGGNATLTPANLGGGSTITFDAVGDAVRLVFSASNWWVVSNNGCVIA